MDAAPKQTGFTWGRLVPALLTGLIAFLFAVEKVYNFDIWWHLRTGAWMLEHGRIPFEDPFSFIEPGAAWINTSWLSGIVLFVLHRIAGMEGLVLFKAGAIGTGFFAAHVYLARKGVNPFLAALLLVAAVVAARFRFMLRPTLFGFLFVVPAWWLVRESCWGFKKRLAFIVGLTVLWHNLHGSAYLLPIFAAALFGEALLHLALRREDAKQEVLKAVGLCIAVCAALLVTPYGLEIPRIVIEHTFSDVVTGGFMVEEHRALRWGEHPMYWALLITGLLSFCLQWKKTRLFDLFVFVAVGVLALGAVRYAGMAALIQAIILSLNTRKFSLCSRRLPAVMEWGFITAVGAAAFVMTFQPGKVYQWGVGVLESRFPKASVDFLKSKGIAGNVVNSWKLGGYLLWRMPEVKTSLDGRALDAHFRFFQRLETMDEEAFRAFLTENDVQAALLEPGERDLRAVFQRHPDFINPYFDDQAAVFIRKPQDVKANSGFAGFRLIQPDAYDFKNVEKLARSAFARDAEIELREAVRLQPGSVNVLYKMGLFLQIQNKAEALEHYASALEANPQFAITHFNLGEKAASFAMKLQQWKTAAGFLETSLEHKPSPEAEFLLGTALYQGKDYAQAETVFRRILDKEPDQVSVLMNLGYLLIDTDRAGEAVPIFDRTVKQAPRLEGAVYGKALALQSDGRAEARQAWMTFLQQFPSSRYAPRARGFLQPEAEAAP